MKEHLHVGLIFKAIDGADLTPWVTEIGFCFCQPVLPDVIHVQPFQGFEIYG